MTQWERNASLHRLQGSPIWQRTGYLTGYRGALFGRGQALLTRNSFLHSWIMWARPWVAARFSFRSRWSGFPRVGFLFITL